MSRRKKIICVLIILLISGVGLFNNTDVVYAGCTKTCDKCNGLGTFGNSASTSGTVSGFNYNSYVKTEGCWNCGGSGTKTVYYASSTPGSGQSYTSGSYTKGTGKVWKACTEGSWVTSDAYGIVDLTSNTLIKNGKRTKSCTGCGAVLKTQYYLSLPCGTGIASTTGGGWYDAGATGSASCTVKTGYTFSKWGDNDTRQSWTNTMNQPKTFTAYATPNSYTQTTNHYLWNPDTQKWDYWTRTTATANYDSTYKPSYTTTPNGYYNYSLGDWANGWTVSGAGTFSVYYYPNTYTVTYDANGGTGAPAKGSFLYNSTYKISSTIPTRPGYTFVNWYVVENGQYLSAGQERPKSWGSFTLKAQWKANNYDLTVSPNGGAFKDGKTEAVVTDPQLTYDAASWWNINSLVPTRTGYIFKGYYDSLSDGTKVYDESGACITGTSYWNASKKYTYAGNLNVYARWEKEKYNIIYHINGGNKINGTSEESITKTIEYEDGVDLSVTASKNTMKFIGWALEPTSKETLTSIPSLILTGDTDGDNAFKNYVKNNELHLYALYSYEVSDIKEVILGIWNTSDMEGTYKEYPMVLKETKTGSYIYALENADVTESLSSTNWSNAQYSVFVRDNAGNLTVLTGPKPPTKEYYEQTEIHQVWNYEKEIYEEKERIITTVKEGETFTPKYLDSLLEWNNGESKPAAYVVSSEKEVVLKYRPKEITVYLNAQGGKFNDGTSKYAHTVYMNTLYGSFPTVAREGYTHLGWYTGTNGTGTKIIPSDRYPYPNDPNTQGPVNLYAYWKVNYYEPSYNYWTNGGYDMETIPTQYQTIAYGSEIYLNAKAFKNGWEFIGWNTDDEATVALTSYKMTTNPKILYALFKKTLSLSLKDMVDTHTLTHTIYNKDTNYVFENIPKGCETNGWSFKGWSTETGAKALINAGAYSNYMITENKTLYAVYDKSVTVSYDTKNPGHMILPETKTAYRNGSGEIEIPSFTVQDTKPMKNNKFMYWYDAQGNKYYPGDVVELTSDLHLTAYWDEFPSLTVYERYFTLSQAKQGKITVTELLKDTKVKDTEDDAAGIPVQKGIDGFSLDEVKGLVNSADIRITYWAADSVGNRVEQEMVFHVVKTEASIEERVAMSRFISKEYFNTATSGVFVSESAGGLKDGSAWKTNATYSSLLTNVLSLNKTNITLKELVFGSSKKEVKDESTGTWSQLYVSHTYAADDIKNIKQYVIENGFSRFLNSESTKEFIERFMNLNITE